jgi:hypothetical protein
VWGRGAFCVSYPSNVADPHVELRLWPLHHDLEEHAVHHRRNSKAAWQHGHNKVVGVEDAWDRLWLLGNREELAADAVDCPAHKSILEELHQQGHRRRHGDQGMLVVTPLDGHHLKMLTTLVLHVLELVLHGVLVGSRVALAKRHAINLGVVEQVPEKPLEYGSAMPILNGPVQQDRVFQHLLDLVAALPGASVPGIDLADIKEA